MVEYKKESPKGLTFDQMLMTNVFAREFSEEIEKQFKTFVMENNIQSFDEIESERSFEMVEGEDGSITYRVIQQYRKKPPID